MTDASLVDVRAFYAALGIELSRWAHTDAPVRCFADPEAHARSDRHASCSVSLVKAGAFHCHGCGASGGAYDAAIARGHTPRSAMDLLIEHHLAERRPPRAHRHRASPTTRAPRRPPRRPRSTPRPALAVSDRDVQRAHHRLLHRVDLLARLEATRGWTTAAIQALQLGLDDRGRVTIPVRDHDGQLISLLRYQPDRPGPKMRAVAGSRRSLYPHPATLSAATLILAEGEPDAIAARSRELAAVAIPGVDSWQTTWAPQFAGRRVLVALDCDPPGRRCAHHVAQDLTGHATQVAVLDLAPDRANGYDLTDWLIDHPDAGDTLLNQLHAHAVPTP